MDVSSLRQSLQEIGAETPRKVCVVCQGPADKQCSACQEVDYCSVEHQKAHWKAGHRKVCTPIEIASTPELGPHYVATRDLPAGTLLLTELPVFISPPLMPMDRQVFSCITCHTLTDWDKAIGCSKCDFFMFCSPACSNSKIHLEAECAVLPKILHYDVKLLIISKFPNLAYLRAFGLKKKDPVTWGKIMGLRGADRFKLEDADEYDKFFIENILPLLGQEGLDFAEDVLKFKGVFANSFPEGTVEFMLGHLVGNADILYLKGSNFINSCFPNCSTTIGKDPFPLEIRTTIEVKKGQVLTLDYTRILIPTGAINRQHTELDIRRIRGLCYCPRCTDPSGTELGTMYSAVKCTKPGCKKGYLLPVSTMDMTMDARWRCNREGCKGKSTWEKIDDSIVDLSSEMTVFFANIPPHDPPN